MAKTTGRTDGSDDILESESSVWDTFLLSCLVEKECQVKSWFYKSLGQGEIQFGALNVKIVSVEIAFKNTWLNDTWWA